VSLASLRRRVPVNVERLISLKEAADRFPLSYSQLRRLARTGRLAATKLGRDWFTTPEDVAAYLANAELRSRDPHKYKRGC
jgi:excisionase family DNA binding protein